MQKKKRKKKQIKFKKFHVSNTSNTVPLAFSLKGLPSTSSNAARTVIVSIAKVVNPLGTVTTLTQSVTSDSDLDYGYAGDGDEFIHENCDEALFRPVVAVFSSSGSIGKSDDDHECHDRPNDIGQELIVPVIEKKNVENRMKTVRENVVLDCRDDKIGGSIKKEKPKKEVEEKANEPEKKERKKSDVKQPKVESKSSGKKTDKTRKDSVSKTDDNETISSKSEKSNKQKPDCEGESSNTIEPEVVVMKLPKKSQKRLTKAEEPKREVTPTKSEETDVNVAKIKIRKTSAKQSEPPADTVNRKEELKASESETEQIKTQDNRVKFEQSNIDVPISVAIPDEKVKDEELPKPIPQERANKKQKKFEKGGLSQWPKVDSQPICKDEGFAFDSSNDDVKLQEDDENEIVATAEKRKKQKKVEKMSRDAVKPIEEWPKISSSSGAKNDEVDVSVTVTSSQNISKTGSVTDSSADYMEILNEELRSMNTDCSGIQESLFKDPVVTTTFTVKKSVKKPSFTDVMNASTPETSSSLKTADYDSNCLEADTFSDVFAPLKPFDIDFEQLTFKDTTDEPISLINFESPSQDDTLPTKSTLTPTSDKNDKEKLIFALCSSLHCEEDEFDNDALPPPPPLTAPPLEGQDSDYKSLELDIDETYLSFELPAPLDTTKDVEANSSDDSEDSSSQCKANKDDDAKYKAGMDEELQPLIGLTMISSDHFDVAKEDDALPVEEEDDAINQVDVLKQTQQMPEKQGFGNKKKSKKKRR